MKPPTPVTHVNVDDLERALSGSAQLAPAFVEQALRWLDPASTCMLEPGVRERLLHLVSPGSRTQRLVDQLARP